MHFDSHDIPAAAAVTGRRSAFSKPPPHPQHDSLGDFDNAAGAVDGGCCRHLHSMRSTLDSWCSTRSSANDIAESDAPPTSDVSEEV